MSNDIDGGGAGMRATETLFRERAEAEVGPINPDVSALVNGGIQAGRRLRRRRQLATGVVAAVAVVAATAIGYAAVGAGMFTDDTAPADPSFEQLVPATPRGMAAAVIEHLPVGYERLAGRMSDSGDVPLLVAFLVPEEPRAELLVMATPEADRWAETRAEFCSGEPCDEVTTPEGIEVVTATDSQEGTGARVTAALANQGDDVVIAVLSAPEDTGPLPLTTEDLVAIVSDPLVGLQTSAEMNASGESIEDWSEDYPFESNGSDTASSVQVYPAPSSAEGSGGGPEAENSSPN
jgi:hypothetical protein